MTRHEEETLVKILKALDKRIKELYDCRESCQIDYKDAKKLLT